MRVCPTCRAEINDYDSICEYCGTELPLNEQFELAIKNSELIINEANVMISDSYKLKKIDLDIVDRLTSPSSYLKNNYSESDLALQRISQIEKLQTKLKDKIEKYKKAQYKKNIRNIVLLSILSEFTLFIFCALVSIFNPDDVEGFIVGIPGLLGLLIGLGLSADSSYVWGGAIVGMLAGGLIGMLIFWLISNPVGQLLLIFGGTIGVVLGIILGIKKAKQKWL